MSVKKHLHYNDEGKFCEATIEHDGESDQELVTAMQQGLDLGLLIYTMADEHVLMGRYCTKDDFGDIQKAAIDMGRLGGCLWEFI